MLPFSFLPPGRLAGSQNIHPFKFIMLGYAAIVGGIYYGLTKKFRVQFKGLITEKLVAFMGEVLVYKPEEHLSEKHYWESTLFESKINHYGGDDLIYGRVGQTLIAFSKLNVKHPHLLKKRVFKGLMFVADFNKTFTGRTYAINQSRKAFLAEWLKWQEFNTQNQITLENPDFSKLFTTYSTD